MLKTYPIRTIELYKRVIDCLDQNKICVSKIKIKINKKPLRIKGIKFNSVFIKLEFYHVCPPGLPPCLRYDIFEGVLAYDVKIFRNAVVNQYWFL